MTRRTPKKEHDEPRLFPKRDQLLDRSGTWAIDEIAKDLFGPNVPLRDALWRARYAVAEAYEFAIARGIHAARLASARQDLSAGLSALSKLQSKWNVISPRFTRAASDLERFVIAGTWWNFGLPIIGEADRPERLSQWIMAGRKASKVVEGLTALASLSKDLEQLGRGHPKAVLRYAFTYSLVTWWRDYVSGRLPPRERKESRSGKSPKSEKFFDFMERARKDAGIRGTSLESPINQIVSKLHSARKTKHQKTPA